MSSDAASPDRVEPRLDGRDVRVAVIAKDALNVARVALYLASLYELEADQLHRVLTALLRQELRRAPFRVPPLQRSMADVSAMNPAGRGATAVTRPAGTVVAIVMIRSLRCRRVGCGYR